MLIRAFISKLLKQGFMLLKVAVFCCLAFAVTSKKASKSELVQIKDLKDWKKELRTKKNVLALFTKVDNSVIEWS